MPVPEGLTGRYIQVVAKMRFGADGGDGVRHTESARPFSTVRGRRMFQDGGPGGDKSVSEEPTYVQIHIDDKIDIQSHIASGGLIPAPESATARKKRLAEEKKVSDG